VIGDWDEWEKIQVVQLKDGTIIGELPTEKGIKVLHENVDFFWNLKSIEAELEHKCQSCKKNEADDFHPCPFSEEIHEDYETLCNCCDSCATECARNI